MDQGTFLATIFDASLLDILTKLFLVTITIVALTFITYIVLRSVFRLFGLIRDRRKSKKIDIAY